MHLHVILYTVLQLYKSQQVLSESFKNKYAKEMTQRDQRQYAEIILGEDVKNIVRRSKTVEKDSCVVRRKKKEERLSIKIIYSSVNIK